MLSVYKEKLKEAWTDLLVSFNEIISEIDIKKIKKLLIDEKLVIEILSVRIDLISRRPEFKSTKGSIRKFLHKHKSKK